MSAVLDGVTPGWPLWRNVSRIGPNLKRKEDALARKPRRIVKWLRACLQAYEECRTVRPPSFTARYSIAPGSPTDLASPVSVMY